MSTLVLVPGASGPREFLFVRARDPFFELWNGSIPSPDDVSARTGCLAGVPAARTEAFDAFFRGLSGVGRPVGAKSPAGGGTRRGAWSRGRSGSCCSSDPARAFDRACVRPADRVGEDLRGVVGPRRIWRSASEVLERLRRVKTPYEQRVMRRAVEIAAEAHIEGMKVTRPGRWEYEVEAAIEHWFLRTVRCRGPIHRLSAVVRMRRSFTTRSPRARCRPATCCSSTRAPTSRD